MANKTNTKIDFKQEIDVNQIFQCLTESIIIIDSMGRLVFLNPSARKLLKCDKSQKSDIRLSELCAIYHADDKQEPSSLDIRRTMREMSTIHLRRAVLKRYDKKQFVVDMNIIPFVIGKNKLHGCILCIGNINESGATDTHEFERRDMKLLGNFVGVLSRQIESWVLLLARHATMLEKATAAEPMTHENAVIISRCAEQFTRLIGQLQSIAKSTSVNREEVRVASPFDVVHKAVRFAGSISAGGRFRITGLEAIPDVEIDETVLMECLSNMLLNINEIIKNDATVMIKGGQTTVKGRRFVVITIKLPADAIDRKLLTSFYHDLLLVSMKTSSVIRIGFPLIKWIIQQWGGIVKISDSSAEELTFSFLLPAGRPVFKISPVRPAHMHFGSILIADDDIESLREMSVMLKNSGYVTIEVSSASNFKTVARKKMNSIALLVVDATMPGYSSSRLIEDIMAMKIGLPILLVSGFSRDYIQSELGYETFSFLQKPFDSQQFISAVNHALSGHSIKILKR
jgi:two-component system cell cycle sensor histidine kinase/response regulator CckA